MRRILWPTFLTVALVAGTASGGQTPTVKTSEVMPFLGTWVFTMTNPQGALETVRISDKDGIVAASVQAGRFPPIDVSGILYDGDVLVLTVRRFENGVPIRAVVSLTRDGEAMNMAQMLENSQTIKRGSGKKQ
jgi:hypothetical protein